MTTTTPNASHLSTISQNSQSSTKSLDPAIIAVLVIGCFIGAIIVVICICCYLNRKRKFYSQSSWKTKQKETDSTSLSAVVTTPNSLPAVSIDGPIPNKHYFVKHNDSTDFVDDEPISTLSVHSAKHEPRETIIRPYEFSASDCCTKHICEQYSKNLKLNSNYFNFTYNKCFCFECYTMNMASSYTIANAIYTVPREWVRFGLRVDQTFVDTRQVFKRWCTVFYGTSKGQLHAVLNNRFIPFPGDSLLSGETFTTHLPDKKHVYTSPSIDYASLRHVCPTDTTKIDNEWYDVQVVLECKQNPSGVQKQHGYRRNVCSIIQESEIEWKTDQRSSVIAYGLLIRAKKHRCTDKCSNRHS